MTRAAWGVLILVAWLPVSGCALAKDVFTKPTGTVTIERQQLINTYAVIRVLYKQMRAQAQLACERGEMDCDELRRIDARAKALNVQIEAKIEVPESDIDWAVVKELLGALIGLVP